MRTDTALLALSLLGGGLLVSGTARAETVLVTNQLAKWKLGTTVASPLTVQVKKGDVIEFKVTGPHGVMTINKPGDQTPSPAPQFVLACGEDANSKPNHILREIECGASSQFGKELTGPMKLEVTDKFQSDVLFWCTVHRAGMWGIIKLAS